MSRFAKFHDWKSGFWPRLSDLIGTLKSYAKFWPNVIPECRRTSPFSFFGSRPGDCLEDEQISRFWDPNDPQGYKARHSNDLIIAYVHDISKGQGRVFPYQMHLGNTGVLIRHDAMFDKNLLVHLVGHVLGAGHNPNQSNFQYKISIFPTFISPYERR